MKNVTAIQIEEVSPRDRKALQPFGFTISGAHITIWAKDQGDAIRRFKAQTEDTVTFITDAEMKRREERRRDEELNRALDEIDDAQEMEAA